MCVYFVCVCVSLKTTIYILQCKLDSRLSVIMALNYAGSDDYLYPLNVNSERRLLRWYSKKIICMEMGRLRVVGMLFWSRFKSLW